MILPATGPVATNRSCVLRDPAFSLPAVERILAAQARPHLASESLADEAREHLAELFQQAPVSVRPTEDYQELLKKAENENQGEDPIDHDQKGDQSA